MSQLTEYDLLSIASQNMHNVGHMDPEVMRDLGIAPPEDVADVVEAALTEQVKRQQAANVIGPVLCWDCLPPNDQVYPGQECIGGHLKLTKAGKVITNG